MSSVQHGDSRAFTALHDRYRSSVFWVAYRVVRQHAAAEEVAQETFTSVWRNCGGYLPERGTVRSWLLMIARNRAVDSFRRESRSPTVVLEDSWAFDDQEAVERVDEEVSRREDARAVRAALQGLPGKQRDPIRLAYFDGYTHEQIAAALDVPLGTVKSRIRLGLDRMSHRVATLAPGKP